MNDTVITPGSTSPLIVLLHGLGSNPSCFDTLKKALEGFFPIATVMALGSVDPARTAYWTINEQANESFEELLQHIPDHDLKSRPTLLIGHSQGGLRAYRMYRSYQDKLNIQGIISLATPWEGAPILNTDDALFEEYLNNPSVEKDMERLSKALGNSVGSIKEMLHKKKEELKKSSSLSGGVSDLNPNSEFLRWAKNELPKETLPMLAIGGSENDFNVFLTKKSRHTFKALRKAWTELIVGETAHEKKHDMIVPLYSQLAYSIVPKTSKYFKRQTIQGAVHDNIFNPSDNEEDDEEFYEPTDNKEDEDIYDITDNEDEDVYDLTDNETKQNKNILTNSDMLKAVKEFGEHIFKSN